MANDMDALAAQPQDERSGARAAEDRLREKSFLMIDVMPIAMFVIDGAANIVFANARLVDLVGISREGLLGGSALQFIDPLDIGFALSLLDSGSSRQGSVMGPIGIRYVDPTGESHHSQFWAAECPPELGVDGYVITLSAESVRDVLATAVASVAADESLDRTLHAIATSGRAAPLDGIGTLLVVQPTSPTDADRFRCVGEWPVSDDLANAYGTPWRKCLVTGEAQDVVDCSLPGIDARTGAGMATAGLPTAWVRPVRDSSGEIAAVLVVWRRTPSMVTINQEAHLGEAVRLAQLAFEQVRHRTALEFAAHRDPLTGVGNRASLNDRIELDKGYPDVLFVDLDHFKAVNETFGHHVGDEVMAQTGRRLASTVRRGDDVYRIAGDQFVIVCAPDSGGTEAPDDLVALAGRILDCLAAPFDCRDHRVRIGASIGTAAGRPRADQTLRLHETISAADRAMHIAKERGRGSVHHTSIRT